MEGREVRGMEIAATWELQQRGEKWWVPSQSGPHDYIVVMGLSRPTYCNCPDYEERHLPCKHILAVGYTLRRRYNQGDVEVTEEVKVTYTQDWANYNAAQCSEGERFPELLADLCSGISEPPGLGTGRPRLPLSLVTFACVYKVFSRFSSRRFTSDLRAAQAAGLIPKAPHFNSVCNAMSSKTLTPVLKELVAVSALPLKAVETDFAVDSSGFSTCRFVRWFNEKYGRETEQREWVKCHLMCGVHTNVVTSAEVAGWQSADVNYFRPLLAETAENFTISEVSADKAYLSKKNVAYVEKFGATPFIPFKVNSVIPRDEGAWARMYHRFAMDRETFLRHYHKRSNVETVFSMMKGKFGDAVLSKSDVGQYNEVLCKVIAHNICVVIGAIHELGIEADFRPAASA